jgi:cysteine desulfurase family protein (TIGR01976 family)
MLDEVRQAVADFYNARSKREIIFGQNTTTLTFHISRCLGRFFKSGDEIILSRMDHDANIAPWLLLAEEKGLKVRWLEFNHDTYEFDDDALDKILNSSTRLLAISYASNCIGTINDVAAMSTKAKAAGAIVYVDAVQFAPHRGIDVQALGCDFLATSAYKWFGPHQGILWGREELLEKIFAYKVRPASNELPHKFETGTLSHEGIAGCLGAIEYIEDIGERVANDYQRTSYATMNGRARALHAAMDVLTEWENTLILRLFDGLRDIKGLTLQGISSANALHRRVPTVCFTLDGHTPQKLAKTFAEDNIFVWAGHNYAIELMTSLGLIDKGGALRVGFAHYNTPEEVDEFLAALHQIIA